MPQAVMPQTLVDRRFNALSTAIAPIEAAVGASISLRASKGSRMSLRVQGLGFELALPKHVSVPEAAHFAEAQLAWMRRCLKANTAKLSAADADFLLELGNSDCIFLLGAQHRLIYDAGVSLVKPDADALRIGLEPAKSNVAQVRRLLSNYALEQMTRIAMQEIKRVSELFGTRMYALSIKAMRSRWGSLAHDNRMSLNFALVFASTECIQYVVCHELAHTLERNHSPRFWAHVARAQPGYKAHHQTLQKQYETYMRLTQRLLEKS